MGFIRKTPEWSLTLLVTCSSFHFKNQAKTKGESINFKSLKIISFKFQLTFYHAKIAVPHFYSFSRYDVKKRTNTIYNPLAIAGCIGVNKNEAVVICHFCEFFYNFFKKLFPGYSDLENTKLRILELCKSE